MEIKETHCAEILYKELEILKKFPEHKCHYIANGLKAYINFKDQEYTIEIKPKGENNGNTR